MPMPSKGFRVRVYSRVPGRTAILLARQAAEDGLTPSELIERILTAAVLLREQKRASLGHSPFERGPHVRTNKD